MPDGNQVSDAAARAPASQVVQSHVTSNAAAILGALHEVMTSCGYVQKQGKNSFHNYKYAGEGDLLEVLRPAMVKAGLLLIPSGKARSSIDEHGNTFVEVEYTLAHKSGAVWPEKIVAFGAGNDRNSKGGVGDKGTYKALTGANKYLLFKLFQIETGDDPEKDAAHDNEPATQPSRMPVKEPVNDAKNAPGITKARKWVSDHLHDLHGCTDSDDFLGMMYDNKGHWVRIYQTYPTLWEGPDGSGLRGEAMKLAMMHECRPAFDAWLEEIKSVGTAKEAAE